MFYVWAQGKIPEFNDIIAKAMNFKGEDRNKVSTGKFHKVVTELEDALNSWKNESMPAIQKVMDSVRVSFSVSWLHSKFRVWHLTWLRLYQTKQRMCKCEFACVHACIIFVVYITRTRTKHVLCFQTVNPCMRTCMFILNNWCITHVRCYLLIYINICSHIYVCIHHLCCCCARVICCDLVCELVITFELWLCISDCHAC